MKTVVMKLKDIRPAVYNPRVALQPGDPEYEALKNSLERFGVAEPLIFNETTGNLVSGHQRLTVLKASGVEETEVVIINLDLEKEKLLNIALNKIEGEWDFGKLEAIFDEIDTEDIKFTGFTIDEINNLFDDYEIEENETEAALPQKAEADGEAAAPTKQKEFSIFLSFPTKELAEKYLSEKDLDMNFRGNERNITIRMEGTEYGNRN